MRRVLEDMYNLLFEQKNALDDLLRLSGEKRGAIIKDDLELLEDTVRQERRTISKINTLEKKRMALMPEITAELGLTGKEITVSQVALAAEYDERERLLSLQRELAAALTMQSAMNKENQELIETHLEYADAMLDLMVDSEDPLNNFYGGDGRSVSDRKKSTGFFDGQI